MIVVEVACFAELDFEPLEESSQSGSCSCEKVLAPNREWFSLERRNQVHCVQDGTKFRLGSAECLCKRFVHATPAIEEGQCFGEKLDERRCCGQLGRQFGTELVTDRREEFAGRTEVDAQGSNEDLLASKFVRTVHYWSKRWKLGVRGGGVRDNPLKVGCGGQNLAT